MQRISAPAAWDVTHGASDVRVAVVDCGIFDAATGRAAGDGQAGHPDLCGKVAMDRDFTGSPTGFDDYCNHGTHCAGTVAAATNNGVGVAGSAAFPLWQVVTVTLDADGHATLTPVQKFVNGSAGTALRFEDGADGPIEWPSTKP